MEFEKFKKHIDNILKTEEDEKKLSDAIEKYLSTGTYCIVDISRNAVNSVIELLADYYSCHFDNQAHLANDISWWLYEDVDKIIYFKENGKETSIDVNKIEDFWKYLENNRKRYLKRVK